MNNQLKLTTLLISLVVTVAQFYYNTIVIKDMSYGDFFALNGDDAQYVYSSESLYNGGDHAYFRTDKANLKTNFIINGEFDKGMYYAFRTPGFAFIHLPIRSLLSFENTLITILLLQVILSALCKFLIIYLAFIFCGKIKKVIWVSLILTNILFFITSFNHTFLSESLAGFLLVYSFFAFYKGQETEKSHWLFSAGIAIMVAVLMRPFLLPILGIYGILMLKPNKFNILKTVLSKKALLFILPTCIFLGGWTIRNLEKTDEVIVLSKTFGWENFSNKGFKEMFYFVHNIGEHHEWWVNKNLTHWYTTENSQLDILSFNRVKSLPQEQIKLIESSRDHYLKSIDTINLNLDRRKKQELLAEKELILVNDYIKASHVEYKLYIPFETFLVFTSTPLITPFIKATYPLNVASVWAESFLNRTILLLGIFGSIVLILRKNTNLTLRLFIFSQFFLIIMFCLFGLNEKRIIYLPTLLSLLPASIWLYELINNKKYIIGGLVLAIAGLMAITDLPDYINF